MSKENGQVSADTPEKTEKSGIRIVQVLAAALAAVTAALLGSTIGVAGTVLGAGLASVITTVGGELYLRSLQRTREAAARARDVLAATGGRRIRAQQDLIPQDRAAADQTVLLPVNPADQPTVQLPRPDRETGPDTGPEDDPSRLRKLRWPLIIGTSVIAFVVAVLAITGIEGATGSKLGGNGNGGTTFFGGGSGHSTEQPKDTPSTSENTPTPTPTPDSTPTTTPTSPSSPTTTPPPSTDSAPPTTTTPQTTTPPPSAPSAPKLTPTPTQ